MAVTNYLALNGRLRGETTSGTRTTYLTDALGSVTATVDTGGAVINTYRYKPFGTNLAHTGIGGAPRIRWATLRSLIDTALLSYSRDVVLTDLAIRLTNNFGLSALRFLAGGNQYLQSILSKQVPVQIRLHCDKPGPGVCGAFQWNCIITISFGNKPRTEVNGWIIQYVLADVPYSDCRTGEPSSIELEFFEAWRVFQGVIFQGSPPLMFAYDPWVQPTLGETYGKGSHKGFWMYAPNQELDSNNWTNDPMNDPARWSDYPPFGLKGWNAADGKPDWFRKDVFPIQWRRRCSFDWYCCVPCRGSEPPFPDTNLDCRVEKQ